MATDENGPTGYYSIWQERGSSTLVEEEKGLSIKFMKDPERPLATMLCILPVLQVGALVDGPVRVLRDLGG